MIARLMAARLRRKWDAYWIECRYMEPFGFPTWAIRAHPARSARGDEIELARDRSLLRALWKARRAYPTDSEGDDR